MIATMDPLGISGHVFGEHTAGSFLSRGAFGFVYGGYNTQRGHAVAIKVLDPAAHPEAHREFLAESSLLLKLTGARRVVDILDSASVDVPFQGPTGQTVMFNLKYHVLEYASEGCLVDLLSSGAYIDWTTKLNLFRDAVLGIHQMHSSFIMHRDIKADNCLVFKHANKYVLKVNDLGRSRDLRLPPAAAPEVYHFFRGDRRYSPPELLAGIGDESINTFTAGDLYGLGSLLFELSTGQPINATVLSPRVPELTAIATNPDLSHRRKVYDARLPEIRQWYGDSIALSSVDVPKVIRPLVMQLQAQLCDPQPNKRFPRVAPGRRGMRRSEYLQWLLNRIDIIGLTFLNSETEARKLRQRKAL